jgi:hypothetical protein
MEEGGSRKESLLTWSVPFGAGLLRSPLGRGIPADVPFFFFMGLRKTTLAIS